MTDKVLNLTQHDPTPEQVEAGVCNLDDVQREQLRDLLTFATLPGQEEIQKRAKRIACFAADAAVHHAMIGGAPYLMAPLEAALQELGIIPLYAFSQREVVERITENGTEKVAVFRHLGFVGKEEG